MTTKREPREKTDWVAPVAIALGGAGALAGVYYFMKKEKGVDPGSTVVASFKIAYIGSGGTYVLQVSFGTVVTGNWFKHVPGLTFSKEISLAGPETFTDKLNCRLPEAIGAGRYDAEALIRTPTMREFDYLIKKVTSKAINVRKA